MEETLFALGGGSLFCQPLRVGFDVNHGNSAAELQPRDQLEEEGRGRLILVDERVIAGRGIAEKMTV